VVVVSIVLLPHVAHAQTTLSGVVRDTSGAVLPGVTVEVGSPALIEKLRSAVTDGSGQYRITDLPPGTYAVTFFLQGFTRVVREGVALSGSGVTTINADLRVDLYNLFNTNDTTAFDANFALANNGATWLQPTAIVPPWFARFNVTFSV
jgi:hypothetical protein